MDNDIWAPISSLNTNPRILPPAVADITTEPS